MNFIGRVAEVEPFLKGDQYHIIRSFLENLEKYDLVNANKIFLGNDISVVFIEKECMADAEFVLEAHRKYRDIHVTLVGEDAIWFKPVAKCKRIKQSYDSTQDYVLFTEQPEMVKDVRAGECCVIDPDMAHMALKGNGFVRKLVFKVPSTEDRL